MSWGGDPRLADPGKLPTIAREGGNLVLRFERADGAEVDTGQAVLFGPSLNEPMAWSEIPIGATSSSPGEATVPITENGNAPDQVTVRLPMHGSATLYCRLKISRR